VRTIHQPKGTTGAHKGPAVGATAGRPRPVPALTSAHH